MSKRNEGTSKDANRASSKLPKDQASLKTIVKRMALESEMAEERALALKLIATTLTDYAKSGCDSGTSLEKCFILTAQILNNTSESHNNWAKALPAITKSLSVAQSTAAALKHYNSEGQVMAQNSIRWQSACSVIEYLEAYHHLAQSLLKNIEANLAELKEFKGEGEEAQAAFNKKLEQAVGGDKKNKDSNRKSGKHTDAKVEKPAASGKKPEEAAPAPVSHEPADDLVLSGSRLVFGVELATVMEKQAKEYPNLLIPKFAYEAVKQIEKSSNYTEGVFRVAGNRKRTQAMIDAIDNGQTVNFSEETDVHVLCSVLKKYLRSMPTPLIPFDLFVDFIEVPKYYPEIDESISEFKDLVDKLPPQNATFLAFLCELLKRVSTHEAKNLMSINNLSCMMAPNMLYRKPDEAGNLLKDSAGSQAVFNILTEHCEQIFAKVTKQPAPHDGDAKVLQKASAEEPKKEDKKNPETKTPSRVKSKHEEGDEAKDKERKGLSGRTKTTSRTASGGGDETPSRKKTKRNKDKPDGESHKAAVFKPEEAKLSPEEEKLRAEKEAKEIAEREAKIREDIENQVHQQEAKIREDYEARLKADQEKVQQEEAKFKKEQARLKAEKDLVEQEKAEQATITQQALQAAKELKAQAELELEEARQLKANAERELEEAQQLRAEAEELKNAAQKNAVVDSTPAPTPVETPKPVQEKPVVAPQPVAAKPVVQEAKPEPQPQKAKSGITSKVPLTRGLKRDRLLGMISDSSSSEEEETLPTTSFHSRLHIFLEMEQKSQTQQEQKPEKKHPEPPSSPRSKATFKPVAAEKPVDKPHLPSQGSAQLLNKKPPAQVELVEQTKSLNESDFETTFAQTLEAFKQLGSNEETFPETLALIYKHIYLFEDQFKEAKISTDTLYDCVVDHSRNWKTKFEFKNNPLMASRINIEHTKSQALAAFNDFHLKVQNYFNSSDKPKTSVSELRKQFSTS